MDTTLTMHAARMAMNRDQKIRQWAEKYLKDKERRVSVPVTDAEFEAHWLQVRPERMHEGALEAVAAYNLSNQEA